MPRHDGDEAIGSDRRAFFKAGGRKLAEDAKEKRRRFLIEQSERDRASKIEQLRRQALETTLGTKDEEEVAVEDEEDEMQEEEQDVDVIPTKEKRKQKRVKVEEKIPDFSFPTAIFIVFQ